MLLQNFSERGGLVIRRCVESSSGIDLGVSDARVGVLKPLPTSRGIRLGTRMGSMLLAMLLAVCVSFSALGAGSAQAAVSSKSLSVPRVTQQETKWCWAASALMIAKFHNRNSTGVVQCDVVQAIMGIGCPNWAATDSQVTAALGWFGFSYTKVSGGVTIGTIKAQIDTSRPMEYDYSYTNGTGKHVVVINGYYYDTATTNPNPAYVYWNDPLDGLNKGGTLPSLLSNSSWQASFTVYNIS